MNKQQNRAIKSLNKALERTHKAGLSVAGIDSSLVIFSYKEYKRLAGQDNRPDLAPSEIINELDYESLYDGNYLDSGGT